MTSGRPVTEAELAALLGVQLAEIEARLEAWAGAIPRGVPMPQPPPAEAQPAPAPELRLTHLREEDPTSGWGEWRSRKSARLLPGGVVELGSEEESSGCASPYIPAEARSLLAVRVSLGAAPEGAPALRVVNGQGEALGPDLPLGSGTTEHLVFLPGDARRLRILLVALRPATGQRFTLLRVELLTADPESHQARLRHKLGAPVIAALASIPDRREMLADAVASLLPQCDRVRVFLNNYPDIPDFLNHPRIDIRRSQDWDDKGDAGKFGWIEALDESGYRIAADDDLIFAPHFTTEMVAGLRRHADHAFVALHGILLRQPIARYYAEVSRHAFHFENPLAQDRAVHVLGTNAFAWHSTKLPLRWADFAHRNMADIFVALYAQRAAIPMITLARPRRLAWQNGQEDGFETIYAHSQKATRSRFDSSVVQDAMIQRAWPLTLQPGPRPKVILLLLASAAAPAQAALETWLAQAGAGYDWVVILGATTQDPSLPPWLAGLSLPVELHMPQEGGPAGALALAGQLGGALVCIATDEIRFTGGGWVREALSLLAQHPGVVLLGHRGADGRLTISREGSADAGMAPCLALATPALIRAAGDLDPELPDALAEWLARLALAQSGQVPNLPDLGAKLFCAPDHRPPPLPAPEPDAVRARVGWRRVAPTARRGASVNEVFERVLVINLDRRADRWEAMADRLARAGIAATRIAAVDGAFPGIAAEFAAYAAQPLLARPTGVRPVTSSWQFYRDHDSQQARIAFEEARTGRRAIASAGALAYLITWEQILESALRDRVETLLVLDDDVAFHRDLPALFAAAHAELPPDWLALQLGTLQYNWDHGAITPAGRHLYRTDGAAIGSHAVGLRFEAFPFLLELVKRRDLPFDIGPLAALTHAWKERCFVITPNAAIQTLEDSDINTSEFQKASSLEASARTYRWHLPDYEV